MPVLILGSILLPDIIRASVHHEGEVALGVEAGGVVVLGSREVDRTSLQTAYRGEIFFLQKGRVFFKMKSKKYSPTPLLSCLTLAFADLAGVHLLRENLKVKPNIKNS